ARTAPKPVAGVRRKQGPGPDHVALLSAGPRESQVDSGDDNWFRGPIRCSGAATPRPALLLTRPGPRAVLARVPRAARLRWPRTPSLARGKAAGGSPHFLAIIHCAIQVARPRSYKRPPS